MNKISKQLRKIKVTNNENELKNTIILANYSSIKMIEENLLYNNETEMLSPEM